MLDDGLDIYGMRSAISVLKGFSDSTVYVISHNDNIKELIENKNYFGIKNCSYNKILSILQLLKPNRQ